MKPSLFLRSLVLSAGLLYTQLVAAGPPNFVFILSDDQSFETVGALGPALVETPNLDRLVRQGLTFRHAYNMGSWSGAVCVASRTMLMTGRMLWHAEALQTRLTAELAAGRLWSSQLQQRGYRTYLTGKWHVSLPAEQAFMTARHVRPGMPEQTEAGYDRPRLGQADPWSPSDASRGGFWQGGRHWSEMVADDAVEFLGQCANRPEPFFMYVAFNAPHDPRQSPAEFVERYPHDQIAIPSNFLPAYPYRDAMGCGVDLRDERLAPFPRTEYAVQVHRQEYYASISHLDQQVGRIVAALEQSGHAANTYLIFTSDHGLAVGHHGLMGKQNQYEHSVRVPFIVVGPQVPANQVSTAPIYLQDVVPTTLELAGGDVPEFVEFRSLVPLIRDPQLAGREAIYGAYLDQQRMITMAGYKLIWYPTIRRLRLYHVARDPDEWVDLGADSSARPIVARLWRRFEALQREINDPLDLSAWRMAWEQQPTAVESSLFLGGEEHVHEERLEP